MNERSERWLDDTVGPENKDRFLNSAQTLKERALENGTIFKGENSEMDENKEVEVVDQETPEVTTEVEAESQTEVQTEAEATEPVDVVETVDVVALKENTEANFEQVAESLLQINKELNERIDGLVARIDELTATTKEVSDIVTDNQKADSVPFASFAAMMANRRAETKEETPVKNTAGRLAEELLKETPAEPVVEKAARPFVLSGLS